MIKQLLVLLTVTAAMILVGCDKGGDKAAGTSATAEQADAESGGGGYAMEEAGKVMEKAVEAGSELAEEAAAAVTEKATEMGEETKAIAEEAASNISKEMGDLSIDMDEAKDAAAEMMKQEMDAPKATIGDLKIEAPAPE